MAKKHLNFVLFWLLIYFFVITIGILISIRITYEANYHQLDIARNDAEEYWDTGEFSKNSVLFRASAYVYDPGGNLLDYMISKDNRMNFSKRAEELIPTIVINGGGHLYKIIFDRGLYGRLAVLIAIPHTENGKVTSIYFFVKSLTSFYGSLVILFIALTFMLLLSAVYSALIIKKDRKLEQIRRNYVANVSHELKSPISSIKALAEVISEGIMTDESKLMKYGCIILKESNNLEQTVTSMLNLSRIQSGFKDFSKTVVRANDLLDPVGEKYKAVCGERGLTLHIMDGSDELPALYTNAACVSELLDILLDNALKFTMKEGRIWLEWSVSAKHITICVKDEGIGIGKEAQPRIFQRFFKEGNDSRGSGLGLAIAEEITAGLGEKIWVQSEPGKGAAFYFTAAKALATSNPLVIKKLQQTPKAFPDL